MAPGRYYFASGVEKLDDAFHICLSSDPDTAIGTLDSENNWTLTSDAEDWIWDYKLEYDGDSLYLVISLAENAPDDYRVWEYYPDGTMNNAASFTGVSVNSQEDTPQELIVFKGGIAEDVELGSGGTLHYCSGSTVTDLRLTATNNNSFFHATFDGNEEGGALSGSYGSPRGNIEFGYQSDTKTLTNMIALNADSQIYVLNGITANGLYMNETYSKVYFESASVTGLITTCRWGEMVLQNSVMQDVTARDSYSNNEGSLHIMAENSTFENVDIRGLSGRSWFQIDYGTISNSFFSGGLTVYFCEIKNVTAETVQASGSELTGCLVVSDHMDVDGYGLFANGNSITLDMTNRKITDSFCVYGLNNIYNSNLRIIAPNPGTYLLATGAKYFGIGDPRGRYNGDTNTWEYLGEVCGDLDGKIDIYDKNGILLAQCAANGETEYFGRYNFTVRIDDSGDGMYLDVGWNTREGRTYAADGYDNLSLETAVVLPESGTKLTIDSADDVDWFKFTIGTLGRNSSFIGIDFKQWAGDLDLYLYDEDGNQLDYAKSVTDNERISLKGLAAGDYYVKVVGYEGNINEYKLAYKLPEPVALTDDYENGDNKAHSYHLGKLSEEITLNAAISRTDDQDYYKFHLPKKGLICDTITLFYDDDFGDLDLYLYGSNGMTLLATSLNTSGGTEKISLAGLKHGEYYVAVKSKDGSIGNYQLLFDVNTHEVNPDKYENNDTLKKAANLYTLNGNQSLAGLSIHQNESKNDKEADPDVDYYKFSILEKGSADDWISISYEVSLGDLDLEILNADGEVVAWSRTAENEDTVSLKGFEIGEYYIRVSGYNNVANNYTLNWNVTNSSLIPSDSYEGMEAIAIRENQTISGLSIAKPVRNDETRADTFKIVLEYDAWKRSRIILADYRSDWEDGLKYVVKDAAGNVVEGLEGTGSEISLYGLKRGEYYLTVDTPNEDEYSEYSLIAQCLPDSDHAKDNTWSFFIYIAGDNNLDECYLSELMFMQQAILPEYVEVYVLMDRADDSSVPPKHWTDTRVGKIQHNNGRTIAIEWLYFNGVNTDTYVQSGNQDLKQEWNTGDIDTLEAFLDWGMQVGRADNYALIVKDHGSSLGYNCSDETDDSMMSISEIAELLKNEKYKDLSVVAFDQCLMGSDVVVTTMEGTVDYVVASEAVGWTPNLLVMYKVLLNSLETEMTPQEVSRKIVAACNCSGEADLTMASFNTSGHTLSEALEAFGEASKGFARQDWVTICKSFALTHNYGDSYWAYSDLGFFLSTLKEYSTSVSGTLMEAAETLYDVVLNQVLESTMITPVTYGSGLAVFNPVLSNDVISFYTTGIGQTAWGNFLYTAGQLAEDCTEFFVDSRTNLTFTDFSLAFEDGAILGTYNLGAFYGNGVEYNGLYMDRKAHFTVSLDKPGGIGDAIRIVADNPKANILIQLVQTQYVSGKDDPVRMVRRTSTNGVLSLSGLDPAKYGVDTEYDLIITSDRETTYSLSFEADWTSGSDFFDYTRSGRIGAQGNGSIEKATVLAAGNYGGLVTYAGDPDFYQLKTVYSDTLSVTVNGTELTVQEYDVDGVLVQGAEYADGKYNITVANGNYLRVEGNANFSSNSNQVNSYSLFISDVSSTYLSLGGTEIQLPEKPVVMDELKNNRVTVTLNLEDGMMGYQSSDLQVWAVCEDDMFVAEDNGLYYFKSVDPETKLESKYTSLRVVGIDHVAPTVSNVAADVTTITNGDVIVIAEFADDVALASSLYRIGENGEWLDYDAENGVTVTENATVFFKAVDIAGNESEIANYEVTNIDKEPPVIVLSGDNTTSLQSSTLTANTEAGLDIFYSTDNQNWTEYEGTLEVKANATYYFKSTDAAGNIGTAEYVFANIVQSPTSEVMPRTQTWEKIEDASLYVVEYSTDNFEHVIRLTVESNSLDSFQMPAGNYQWRVKAEGNDEWIMGEPLITTESDKGPKLVKSDENGNADVFFANPVETWEAGYIAQHVGSINDWNGTNEYASVFGKNKLADVIEGSNDANILLMTDDPQGDSLFVDDIYTTLPGSVTEQQSRIAQIDEIRAGAGNDIVDMTSQQFEYIGDGLTIRGGDGNDTIWANKGDNFLFGDAGNDRIVGASGNDVIAGGIGNDRMHGGGGNDVFTFCDNWGVDNVEQLATGSVTLWFAEGSKDNWSDETLTYTDGDNSVKVSGVTLDKIMLKFGDDGSAQFAALSGNGAFNAFSSQKIFEESGKGMLASL